MMRIHSRVFTGHAGGFISGVTPINPRPLNKRPAEAVGGGLGTFYVVSDGIAPSISADGTTLLWLDLGDSCI